MRLFLIVSFLLVASAVENCDRFLHTGTIKTLVKFYNSSENQGLVEEQINQFWQKLIVDFSDFPDLSFIEHDCNRCPEYCYNFWNESLPSFTMVYNDLIMAACVKPQNYQKAKHFIFDYMPKKYIKQKKFDISSTDLCYIVYPECKGKLIFEDEFEDSIESGISFVLYRTQWCHWCHMFAPYWNRLIKLLKDKPIKFYHVDCIASKEFCYKNNAVGFPTLNVYKDGKFIQEYLGTESVTELEEFAKNLIRKYQEEQLEGKNTTLKSSYDDL